VKYRLAYVTTNDFEMYFRSNAAVEVVAIVSISFVSDLCRIFEISVLYRCPIAKMTFQYHSMSSKMARYDFLLTFCSIDGRISTVSKLYRRYLPTVANFLSPTLFQVPVQDVIL